MIICLEIIDYRKRIRNSFGLLLREEIHAAKMLNKPGELVRIQRNDRLSIIKYFVNELALMQDLSIINVVVDKQGKGNGYDVLGNAWRALVQRFSNTMSNRNFPGPANADDRGLIIPDMSENRITVRASEPETLGQFAGFLIESVQKFTTILDSMFEEFLGGDLGNEVSNVTQNLFEWWATKTDLLLRFH